LFSLLSEASLATSPPVLAFKEAAVSDVQWPGDSKLLISSNNFIDNSLLFSADPTAAADSNATVRISLLSANMKNGTTFALSRIQVSEFFYQGDGDWLVEKAPMEETPWARPQVCGCAISKVVRMATALMTF
jgi:hypothetical protein